MPEHHPVRLVELLHRRPDIDVADFHREWGGIHAEIVRGMRDPVHYAQSRPEPGSGARCDGVAELWFSGWEDAARLREDAVYKGPVTEDGRRFVDTERFASAWMSELDSLPPCGPIAGRRVSWHIGEATPEWSVVEEVVARWQGERQDARGPFTVAIADPARHVRRAPAVACIVDAWLAARELPVERVVAAGQALADALARALGARAPASAMPCDVTLVF